MHLGRARPFPLVTLLIFSFVIANRLDLSDLLDLICHSN